MGESAFLRGNCGVSNSRTKLPVTPPPCAKAHQPSSFRSACRLGGHVRLVCLIKPRTSRAIFPKRAARFPIRAQAFVVRHSVLDDERLDPLRMGQGHAEANGTAVILHVKSKA